MKKRILSVIVTLSFALVLTAPAFAAVKDSPATNAPLDSITVSIPQYPSLEITLTNVPYLAGEISGQTKIYCGSDTTASFNQDMSMGAMGAEAKSFKAGEVFKPMSVHVVDGSPWAVGMSIVVENGKVRFTTSNNITTNGGQIYQFTFCDVEFYQKNIAEGSTMTDIRDWEVEGSSASASSAPSAPVTAQELEAIQQKFDKWYANDLIALNTKQGENTIKTAVKDDLVFYSYDPAANSYKTLTVEHSVSSGSVTFTAPASGIIVISEGKFAK